MLGANVPALLRALVACGWFGIQTWIGGLAIYTILAMFIPRGSSCRRYFATMSHRHQPAELGCFLLFWLVNMLVIYWASSRSASC